MVKVMIYGLSKDNEMRPENYGENVALEDFIDEYDKEFPDCKVLVITITRE